MHGTAFFGGRGLFDGEKTPDFARELAKLKKLDKLGLKNISDIQKKQLNKLVKRN